VVWMEPTLSYSRTSSGNVDSVAFLVSVPRGGAEAGDGERKMEETVHEIEAEVEELLEEVAEEAVEAIAAEIEEEADVVFPTDELPSDDVRFFHTTDGELADDEGMYTDGQNDSPIADNEAAADTIGVTAVPAGGDENHHGDDPSTEATAFRTAVSVAFIDDDLKRVLMTDLRYTKVDVSLMRPDIAKEVARNKLARPTEGMPKNWYSDPDAVNQKQAYLSPSAKRKIVVSVAVAGVAALSVGVLKENDTVGDTIEEIVGALQAIPKSLVAMVVAAKRTAQKSSPMGKMKEEPQEEEEKEDEPETMDTSIHSIKPGTTPKEVPDPEADHTWLDKVLTRMAGLVKSFFSIKI